MMQMPLHAALCSAICRVKAVQGSTGYKSTGFVLLGIPGPGSEHSALHAVPHALDTPFTKAFALAFSSACATDLPAAALYAARIGFCACSSPCLPCGPFSVRLGGTNMHDDTLLLCNRHVVTNCQHIASAILQRAVRRWCF